MSCESWGTVFLMGVCVIRDIVDGSAIIGRTLLLLYQAVGSNHGCNLDGLGFSAYPDIMHSTTTPLGPSPIEGY